MDHMLVFLSNIVIFPSFLTGWPLPCHTSKYEDRTSCFFPPAPKVPRIPGLVSDGDDSLSNSSQFSPTIQRLMYM
jgi:hypothetical protein